LADLRSILSDPQFPALVERLEASAWLGATEVKGPGRELASQVIDGAILIIDRSEDAPLSRAFNLGIERPLSLDTLERIIEAYATAGITSFSTHLLPIARPTHAPRLLEQAGFSRGAQQAAVVRPVGGVDPADAYFRIREATPGDVEVIQDLMSRTTADPGDWARTFSTVVTNGNYRVHLAFEGSTAYAMGGFFYSGETALLFTQSWVVAGYETHGVQGSLIQTALRDAESLGCRWVVCLYPVTAETRTRHFQRMGFEVMYQRRLYFYGPLLNHGPPDPLNRGVRA
jgi:N-acetylglutamate synthase-like GNAT family acetyltransferase